MPDSSSPEAIPNRPVLCELHKTSSARVFYSEGKSGELEVVKQFLGEEDNAARGRFDLEAKFLGTLDHPQTPRLKEDNTDHFHPHFVMEPVMGVRDLREFFHRNSSPLMASRIIHSILSPIEYIHGQDLVHRDIKTGNIIGRFLGNPVLSDFGIAARRKSKRKLLDEEPRLPWADDDEEPTEEYQVVYHASTGLTETGGCIGTTDFMSPEQLRGQEVDTTSDIYNLGITFYEILYGKVPFPVDTGSDCTSDTSSESFLHEDHVSKNIMAYIKQIEAHRKVALRHVNERIDFSVPRGRDVPMPLIEVIDRATQKHPSERYQSAAEMREDLERAIARVGVSTVLA